MCGTLKKKKRKWTETQTETKNEKNTQKTTTTITNTWTNQKNNKKKANIIVIQKITEKKHEQIKKNQKRVIIKKETKNPSKKNMRKNMKNPKKTKTLNPEGRTPTFRRHSNGEISESLIQKELEFFLSIGISAISLKCKLIQLFEEKVWLKQKLSEAQPTPHEDASWGTKGLFTLWSPIEAEFARIEGRGCRQSSSWILSTASFSKDGTLSDESIIWAFSKRQNTVYQSLSQDHQQVLPARVQRISARVVTGVHSKCRRRMSVGFKGHTRKHFSWFWLGTSYKIGIEEAQYLYSLPEKPKLRSMQENQDHKGSFAGNALVMQYFEQKNLVTW